MIFKTKSIQRAYFISSFLIASALLIILAAVFFYQTYQNFEDEAERQKIEYVKSQKEIVKNEVNRAVGFIEFNKAKIAKRVKAGKNPDDVKKEIQNDIVRWIQGIRFNEGGYVFLSSYDGIVLVHHRPEHIGKNLWDLTDPNGVKIHQTILKAGTEPDGGYMEYVGTKNPVTGKPGKKITFSKSIDDWKWLVGSGFYIDNIEPVIAEKKEQLTERVKSQIIHAVLIFLIVGVLATLIMNIFPRRIRKQFDLLNEFFQRSVTAYEKVDKDQLPYEEFRTLSDSINKMVDEHKRAEEELEQSFKSLRKSLNATINVLVAAVEVRDPYTAGHQSRVADLARAIATEMGLPKEKIEGIRVAGAIHDIGKISVPSEILSKPGSLNDIEFGLITPHPQVGYDILKDIEFPWPVALIVLQHHERMDGSGYPQGLSGEEICLEARIMGVADVVEAMSSHRPYRPALGTDKALEEISQNKGTLYDPEVVDACVRLFTEKGFTLV